MNTQNILHLSADHGSPYVVFGLLVPTALLLLFYAYYGVLWAWDRRNAVPYILLWPASKWVSLIDKNGIGTDHPKEQEKGFSWQPRDS